MTKDPSGTATPQPGREPVPPDAWSELTRALRAWADALQVRWHEASFRLYGSWSYRSGTLTVATTTEPGAAVTPAHGNPIRGALGVTVAVNHKDDDDRTPKLSDGLSEFPLSAFGGPKPTVAQQAAYAAREHLGAVASKYPELRRAIMRVSWGPRA